MNPIYAKRRRVDVIIRLLCVGAAAFGVTWLALILFTLFYNGLSGLSLQVFTQNTPPPGSTEGGLLNAITGSIIMTAIGVGIGGPLGNGRQWFSWVHHADLCGLFRFLVENDRARGAFNGTAPNPVTMRDFARALGRTLHRPSVFAVPRPMLRLTVGEAASFLVTGQRAIPRRTQEAGFRFEHPVLEEALASLVGHRAALQGGLR